jgi:DNA-binding transcriptional LysR family regulator
MNFIDCLQTFARVAELSSFTKAAEALNLPKASVSNAVQQLEAMLETRLLHRTTRKVQLTQDGQTFYERSKDLLADADDLQTMFQQPSVHELRGRIRIDMSTGLVRHVVMPRLPELLKLHPLLELEISSTERRVDLVSEGFDCVLRTGQIIDSGLIARPLGLLRMANCASPAYVADQLSRGMAMESLQDLAHQQCVHFVNTFGAKPSGFEYVDAEGTTQTVAVAGAIFVNNAEAYVAACMAGLGIIQVPSISTQELTAQGSFVEVFPNLIAAPMPLNLLYANRRNLSKRVRVVMDWLADVIHQHIAVQG